MLRWWFIARKLNHRSNISCSDIICNAECFSLIAGHGGFGTVERGEQYRIGGSRTATLEMKGRRKGSVPFADIEDDPALMNEPPARYGETGPYGTDGSSPYDEQVSIRAPTAAWSFIL